MDVYSLKTRTDAFIWLAHMEGDLLSIRASVNAGSVQGFYVSHSPSVGL
ncbi:TPA: hypothetical protein ACTPQP_000762 [Salmonella enterica]|nr:hypothetical protein [Salmonella enterica]EIJ8060078.1 hypothetical protein [Salmonella enterica]EJY5193284.1 hypothetical protein [Salmonella enterica]ELD1681176.1 hypothetical protein [Salmonella enterica]ELN2999845.1 hypothetical protein [Salmonella enterica]